MFVTPIFWAFCQRLNFAGGFRPPRNPSTPTEEIANRYEHIKRNKKKRRLPQYIYIVSRNYSRCLGDSWGGAYISHIPEIKLTYLQENPPFRCGWVTLLPTRPGESLGTGNRPSDALVRPPGFLAVARSSLLGHRAIAPAVYEPPASQAEGGRDRPQRPPSSSAFILHSIRSAPSAHRTRAKAGSREI